MKERIKEDRLAIERLRRQLAKQVAAVAVVVGRLEVCSLHLNALSLLRPCSTLFYPSSLQHSSAAASGRATHLRLSSRSFRAKPALLSSLHTHSTPHTPRKARHTPHTKHTPNTLCMHAPVHGDKSQPNLARTVVSCGLDQIWMRAHFGATSLTNAEKLQT